MNSRLEENCTITLNGPRGSGWSWALEQFLINDCKKAIIICPSNNIKDRIEKGPYNKEIKNNGHIFLSVDNSHVQIRGLNYDTVIFSDYSLMKQTKKREIQQVYDMIRLTLQYHDIKFLIKIH